MAKKRITQNKNLLLNWKIGGEAGFGIKVTGEMFSRMLMRAGYHTYGYAEYPSLIRGGHNAVQVTAGVTPVRAPERTVDMLICLDQETWREHADELVRGAAVMYDSTYVKIPKPDARRKQLMLFPAPLEEIARSHGNPLMRNTIALGMTVALLGLPEALLTGVLASTFQRKDPRIVAQNLAVAREGAKRIGRRRFRKLPPPREKPNSLMTISGNTALSLGAIRAGLQFYAGYPMTPSTTILEFLAKEAAAYGYVVKHAEDEISVVNMAVGAAFAGARAMVGTAGGGFALMSEGLGLASMTEVGIVMIDAQRPGPATGLPTWTGQGDLRFVMHTAQDDVPRIVLAPGDAEECFYMTAEALNIAEEYQLPVILLTDKLLGESDATFLPFDEKRISIRRGAFAPRNSLSAQKPFARYRNTASGISPRILPGTPNGMFIANSDEHNVNGLVDETSEVRRMQHEKRLRKVRTFAGKLPRQKLYGPTDAAVTFVGWGSTKGSVLDALDTINQGKRKANFLHITQLAPFPARSVQKQLQRSRRIVAVEGNATGQFAGLLREQTGIAVHAKLLKYDGRPFYPSEIVEHFPEYV